MLVCDALRIVLWQRGLKVGLVHHSEWGSQYASKMFRWIATRSWHPRVQWQSYQTRWEAQQDILLYIAVFYNRYRMHSTLNYVSPNDYEKQFHYDKMLLN